MTDWASYLSLKTDTKFKSNHAFTAMAEVRVGTSYSYTFTIDPEEAGLRRQAEHFSDFCVTLKLFDGSFLFDGRRFQTVRDLLIEVYMYSYVKAVFYSVGKRQRYSAALFPPGNNICLLGHAELYNIICAEFLYSYTPPNNSISVRTLFITNVEDMFSSWTNWITNYIDPTDPERVFNPQYESVLSWLYNKQSIIKTVKLNPQSSSTYDHMLLANHPIGNSCFSGDMQQILFLETTQTSVDIMSFGWGVANFIKAVFIPAIDADDEVYDTVLVSRLDRKFVYREVHSIIGCPIVTDPYDKSSVPSPSPEDDTRPSGGNPPRGGGGRGNGGSSGGRGNSNSGRGRQPSNRTGPLNAAQQVVNKYGSKIVSAIRKIDELMTDEKAILIAQVISDITGKKIKPKSLKQYIGKKVGLAFSDFGVDMSSRLTGSDAEYDAFYVESDGQRDEHGNFRAILVGRPKTITQ